MLFIYLISAFGITYFIKESDIMNVVRIQLIKTHPIFAKLLQCYFCLGFWVSIGTYLVSFTEYKIFSHILWSFAGAAVSFVIGSAIHFFHKEPYNQI